MDINHLKARFEKDEAEAVADKPHSGGSSPSRQGKKKVAKIGSALMKQTKESGRSGVTGGGGRTGPKPPSKPQPSPQSSHDDFPPTVGMAVLASVTTGGSPSTSAKSQRRTPPVPPAKPTLVNSEGAGASSPRLAVKSRSVEELQPSNVSPARTRPFSTAVVPRNGLEHEREEDGARSDIGHTPHRSTCQARSASYEHALEVPVSSVDSPFLSRNQASPSPLSSGASSPVKWGKGSTEAAMTDSFSEKEEEEEEDGGKGADADRKSRASSLPRGAKLKSPPPTDQSKPPRTRPRPISSTRPSPENRPRSSSSPRSNRRTPPPPPPPPTASKPTGLLRVAPSEKSRSLTDIATAANKQHSKPKPPPKPKPALLPKPKLAAKSPSLSNLKRDPGFNSPVQKVNSDSSRETTPSASSSRSSTPAMEVMQPLSPPKSTTVSPPPPPKPVIPPPAKPFSPPPAKPVRPLPSTSISPPLEDDAVDLIPHSEKVKTNSRTLPPLPLPGAKLGKSSTLPPTPPARPGRIASDVHPESGERPSPASKLGKSRTLPPVSPTHEGSVEPLSPSHAFLQSTTPDRLSSVSSVQAWTPMDGVTAGNRTCKADSGFISEAPDDLAATRELSTESISVTPPTPPVEVWDEARLEKARGKRRNIAQEFLDTEITYVTRLRKIAVDFYTSVNDFNKRTKHSIADSDVVQIFLNIRQIHSLNEKLLEDLQQTLDNWSSCESLGVVLSRLAPFLRLYAHYTAGFEEAMKKLTECMKKDKKFDLTVKDFERTCMNTGLGVAHYMLEPVQRIPRYRLLLKDYLKYLPPDAEDRSATEKALDIISEAADRSNDRIKELENSNEILLIQRSLLDYEGSLLQPSRIFLKRGMLQKFSRKTLTPRMFFLFSDVLLHTSPSGSDVFHFKDEMPIHGMVVEEPLVKMVPHSFNVCSIKRSLILAAGSDEEMIEWMEALMSVIHEDVQKRSTLQRTASVSKKLGPISTEEFGTKAPIMVPDKSVTMCQACGEHFTFTFRRHHCRNCGKVVCGNCSQWKVFLQYMNKNERVCLACFQRSSLGGSDETDLPSPAVKKQDSTVLDLKAIAEDTVMAGYVEAKKSGRLWYQLKKDLVLYKFRAHEDIKAIHSMPLPGYVILKDRKDYSISLIHPSQKKELCDFFKAESMQDFDNWVSVLEKATILVVPEAIVNMRLSIDSVSPTQISSPRTSMALPSQRSSVFLEERKRSQSLASPPPSSPPPLGVLSGSLNQGRPGLEESV